MTNHNSTPRVAIYARVSTKNNGQNPLTQLMPLRDYAQARGFEVFKEYTDIGISGSKEKRPALDRLMRDAQRRKFDLVLVARFDRFARSTKHLVLALEEFKSLGIQFVSYQENVDTGSPLGNAIFTIIGAMAQLERDIIVERVKAGLRRAKNRGKQLGRPKGTAQDVRRIIRLKNEGLSLRKIARRLRISKSTVARLLEGVL